jgi:hypothetical protein
MEGEVPEDLQRWTAKRRVALVTSILKGETSVQETLEGPSSRSRRMAERAKRCFASSHTRPRMTLSTSTQRHRGRPAARRYCVSKLDRKRREGLQCRHLRLLELPLTGLEFLSCRGSRIASSKSQSEASLNSKSPWTKGGRA